MQEIVYKEGEEAITVWNFSVKWKGMVRLREVLLGGGICKGEEMMIEGVGFHTCW